MKRALALVGAASLILLFAATPAPAQQSTRTITAQLSELNGSGASGQVNVTEVSTNRVTVSLDANGVSPGVPHAQHFHIGGRNVCPPASADTNGDGLVNTAEGMASYGPIKVSLTESGDLAAGSGLAVDRFPTGGDADPADGRSEYEYLRTFTLPSGVSIADLEDAVVVVHGVTDLFGDPAAFDGDQKSPLDDSLPLEATIPAACGKLRVQTAGQVGQVPSGGVSAGFGGTAGQGELPIAPVAGAVAAIGGVGVALVQFARRQAAGLR